MSGWDGFLAEYHSRHPAITEDLLRPMRGPGPDGDVQPYEWLCEGLDLSGPDALVWDLACGSAPVADVVGLARYAGVDLSEAELAVARDLRPGVDVTLGDALAVEPPRRPAAVTVAMALMLVPLEELLARAAALLGPGAPLQAIVPTREHGAGTGYGVLLERLGQQGQGYRQRLAPAALAEALTRHGFDLVSDQVAVFRRPVGPDDVDLVVRSFYVRAADGPGPDAARAWLAEQAARPGYELDYPLRRIRAVRAGG
ncbi:class I SAM-dependent methyltransferase [Aquipuribacter sp. MA13-6]|uniref:class I SAM-dependent methyltransferase n=1 Tax=unclassified Aquipuribacter TaxID=2635084 RepID=UPI003EEF423B